MTRSSPETAWAQLVDAYEAALAYWRQTNEVLAGLPPVTEFEGQAGRDHEKAVVDLDACEDALLEATPPNGAGVAYQFKVAAERFCEVEVLESPSEQENAVFAAILRRTYATLLAMT